MNTETNNTGNTAENTANASGQQNQQQGGFGGDFFQKILNSPLFVSLGLGAFIYWLVGPTGLKGTLHEMQQQMKTMVEIMQQQNETIHSLKKQIVKLRKRLPDNETDQDNDNLSGYRKAKRKERGAYLD